MATRPPLTRMRRAVQAATPAPTPAPAPAHTGLPPVDIHRKLAWEYVSIDEIVPYALNARENEEAVPAVMASITSFGFLIPVVLDEQNVIIAGHTRVEAAKRLGMSDVPAIRASHLTEEQAKQFRLIDNKVASIARWDYDMLAQEMTALADTGIDWTKFGWTQEDVDCLSDVVAADCLDGSESATQATTGAAGTTERRAPNTARCVIGEFVFFVPATDYRAWADGIRNVNEFNEQAIVADLKRRLGMTF